MSSFFFVSVLVEEQATGFDPAENSIVSMCIVLKTVMVLDMP